MAYTRTYTIDAGPAGDTVKAAVATKLDGDLTTIFANLTTHEAMTTNAHGVGSGTVVGSATTDTLTNKTLSAPTLTGTVTMSGATLTGGNSVNMTLTTPTITGSVTASGATITGGNTVNQTITTPAITGGTGVNMTLTTPTLTGTIPASGATLSSPSITGGTTTNMTLVTPALGTPASGTLSNCTLAAPSAKGVVYLEPKTNLLINSQWMAVSGSILADVANQISVTQITAGVCTTAATQGLAVGKLVQFGAGGSTTNKVYEVTAVTPNTSFTIHDTSITDATDVTCYEVTPGYIGTDALAPDGMTKTTTLDIHQYWNAASANTYGYGKYNFLLAKGVDTAEYLNFGTAINYRDVQGKPVALGCYVYSLTAADNVKLSIHDGVSEIALSSAYCPANAITWMEITGTVAANASALTPRILCDGNTSDCCYISEPILIRGSSIGVGNYQPIPNEVIWLQTSFSLTGFNNSNLTTQTTPVNLEAASSGKIGKGIKAIKGILRAQNSAAGLQLMVSNATGAGGEAGGHLTTQVANVQISGNINGPTDSNGDIFVYAEDGNFTAAYITISAIQT